MIDLEVLDTELKQGKIENKYAFVGLDEMLIKEYTTSIIDQVLDINFRELNLVKIDGMNTNFTAIMDACETMPFMAAKKVVLIYRANFLKDKADSASKSLFKEMQKYLKDIPEHCVLIMYYLFEDKRDRAEKSTNLKAIDKNCKVVKADKLRGEKFLRKVKSIFDEKGKNIEKVELKYFCDSIENNFNIIQSEIEKLICYVGEKEITLDDIKLLLPKKEDEDVFDLIEFISLKRPEKAIDLMNDLLFRGESITKILSLVEGQLNLLFKIKVGIDERKSKEVISREIRRPLFVVEKLIAQSRKFSYKSLQEGMKSCIETEKKLKSSTADKKTEMELLFLNLAIK
ncbi:DNA polymerase III subunit delta [Inconstantimicrobium mannanitabidum]|uniref:DNA polymerase III subunit delta n=1 Tax=Inconstantimicrobium mannanitabidum TaxID=1604901 RepID=A0ACB5R9L9_9CLOT|nr:DNA polymerase III subunit delta [Clostridium sp. TW13]GKX65559.1 DNA polymerase III subunit delta [Clostridium sp. TW13]